MRTTLETYEKLHFKQQADGWLFRAPAPGAFRRMPHFIVNEAQKTAILDLEVPSDARDPAMLNKIRPIVRYVYLFFAAWMVLAGCIAAYVGHAYGEPVAMAVLLAIIIGPIIALYHRGTSRKYRKLEPVLKTCQRTSLVLKHSEVQQQLMGNRFPIGAHLFWALIMVGLAANQGYQFAQMLPLGHLRLVDVGILVHGCFMLLCSGFALNQLRLIAHQFDHLRQKADRSTPPTDRPPATRLWRSLDRERT